MDSVSIRATAKTPKIDFNPDLGILEISGCSTPEDSRLFYKPLIAWAEEYASHPADRTVVDVNLEHFDTSSSKGLLDLIKRLKSISELKKEIEIVWHYESNDEDILEAGENFKHITGLPFRMAPH
jgi:hypothetical protein